MFTAPDTAKAVGSSGIAKGAKEANAGNKGLDIETMPKSIPKPSLATASLSLGSLPIFRLIRLLILRKNLSKKDSVPKSAYFCAKVSIFASAKVDRRTRFNALIGRFKNPCNEVSSCLSCFNLANSARSLASFSLAARLSRIIFLLASILAITLGSGVPSFRSDSISSCTPFSISCCRFFSCSFLFLANSARSFISC